MGDHHDCGVLRLAVGLDVAKNFRASHGVKAGGGFVQNENFRLHGNDARNGDPALLAAGKVKGRNLQLLLRKPHEPGGFPDAAIDFLR